MKRVLIGLVRKTGVFLFCSGTFYFQLPVFAGEFPDEWTFDGKPEVRAEHAALEGKTMPSVNLSDWMNGVVTAGDIRGKVVIVDFFATWCGPCMRAIPHNNELLKKYKEQGLVIIGVCTSKGGQEKMEETVKARGIQYSTARDRQLISERNWHVHYYPTYAIADRKGIVRVVGLQPSYVERVIKKLLEEPAPKG